MKTKNKILAAIVMLLLVFGVTSCGGNKQGVTYQNYKSIVVSSDVDDPNDATDYAGLITLFGTDLMDDSNYSSGDGTIVWGDLEEGPGVTVTLDDEVVTAKESFRLYESVYTTPLGEKTGVWEWVVLQIGYFTYYAGSLFGLLNTNFYWLGLLIMTLVIRTLGWPIYAKTNDMSLKMQIAQPELSKIQEKYRNKKDQASQQRMQMETMEVYKRYKINLLGCFMPLLQMPIFIAMYQVVQRFPRTGLFDDVATGFLWTDLGNTYWLENLPLALLVAGLMFLSQWLTTKRTKSVQKHSNYQSPSQQQTQKTMKYMMYFMVIMMAYISIGNAGIAFYWVIGTAYQLLQSYISHRNVDKRKDQIQSRI
ncbi:MAG: YidC/Oxa1 family membrane protein insertase [Candidatus Izemoplasmatales bacterium]|jgi:YidC/Oxa1 family membrane protein insertase|nr:YidC/Oxa1 family membrane protein insertase [Candidatus Izemoplasmatales bacterium]MDD4069615.1 YidC/Oxa1 family membrane protein insertase [Candidatus Izemoplasmatales bacterium]